MGAFKKVAFFAKDWAWNCYLPGVQSVGIRTENFRYARIAH